jgi:hypothetical protein
VSEADRADTLRVVEASLAPPAWMGPVDAAAEAAAEAHEEKAQQIEQLLGDYGKLVEDGELADGVFVVEGERFPLHRNVLAARSEYFRARFKSGMQDGGSKEVCYEDVSASAFRVLLRFLYAGDLGAATALEEPTAGIRQGQSDGVLSWRVFQTGCGQC